MKIKSSKSGEYPFGTHWTPGEVREVSKETADNAPKWLSPATESTPKKKKAKDPAPPRASAEG